MISIFGSCNKMEHSENGSPKGNTQEEKGHRSKQHDEVTILTDLGWHNFASNL
jgi:hypothetical protein